MSTQIDHVRDHYLAQSLRSMPKNSLIDLKLTSLSLYKMSIRVANEEFQSLDLQVHSFLNNVPLHDVSAIDLPGSQNRMIGEVRAFLFSKDAEKTNPIVNFLFQLRFFVGRLLRWDETPPAEESRSYQNRLSAELRSQSQVEPGTADGPFRVLYQLPHESLSEIQNATVHAFLCLALVPQASGFRFYLAVYVLPVSWFTPIYMAAIEPFRRFLVYPAILRKVRSAWVEHA